MQGPVNQSTLQQVTGNLQEMLPDDKSQRVPCNENAEYQGQECKAGTSMNEVGKACERSDVESGITNIGQANGQSGSSKAGSGMWHMFDSKRAASASKARSTEDDVEAMQGEGEEPRKFVSWNANSFLLRMKNERDAVLDFVRKEDPDVIAIQEVRMPAAGKKGEPKLQDTLKDDTGPSRNDMAIMLRALATHPLSQYKIWWSLGDNMYGGTALLVKKSICSPAVSFNLEADAASKGLHEMEGRAIVAEFKSLTLMTTYVPNNSWRDEPSGFQRRRDWDRRVLQFLLSRQKTSSSPDSKEDIANLSCKPLVWCGDLNVSHKAVDVTHPEFFRDAKKDGYIPPNAEDRGQPGYTPAERFRFSEFLRRGDLVDAYRLMHPEKDYDAGYTWSGHPVGKYCSEPWQADSSQNCCHRNGIRQGPWSCVACHNNLQDYPSSLERTLSYSCSHEIHHCCPVKCVKLTDFCDQISRQADENRLLLGVKEYHTSCSNVYSTWDWH